MIPNCEGCEWEIEEALRGQEAGLHLATTKDIPTSYPNNKGHFGLIMVDDNGVIQWK